MPRASPKEALGPISCPRSGRFPSSLFAASWSPSWRLPCAKIAELRRARRRAATSSLQGRLTAPEPRLPREQRLGGPPGRLVRLHPGAPEPWERGAAGGAHARLRPGSLPSLPSLGKFGEVCLGSGGRPKGQAALGMRPGALQSPGSRLGGGPRAERRQKVGRRRPFVCGTGESLAHKRSSALRRRLSLRRCTSASEALHYSRAFPPPPPGPSLCSA